MSMPDCVICSSPQGAEPALGKRASKAGGEGWSHHQPPPSSQHTHARTQWTPAPHNQHPHMIHMQLCTGPAIRTLPPPTPTPTLTDEAIHAFHEMTLRDTEDVSGFVPAYYKSKKKPPRIEPPQLSWIGGKGIPVVPPKRISKVCVYMCLCAYRLGNVGGDLLLTRRAAHTLMPEKPPARHPPPHTHSHTCRQGTGCS